MKNHFVHTPCGPVQGAAGGADGVSVFRGIRYATAGRWEYPRQVTHWDGVYDAANFGACSFQPRAFYNEEDVPEKAFYYNEFRRGEHYDYSEDCLFLNIWAPDDAKNAPVLFYIHGGGFLGGCGHEKHFDGTAWCKKGVVAVTINYRLGPMGFLCLPELAARDGHTGNYAMFDQMAALCWVRDNIAAFGGDPGQVTLMGQSAGAMSVQQLCVSPMTNGLFRGAVMMSGGGVQTAGRGAESGRSVSVLAGGAAEAGRGRFCGAVRRRTAGAVRGVRRGKERTEEPHGRVRPGGGRRIPYGKRGGSCKSRAAKEHPVPDGLHQRGHCAAHRA